MQQSKPFFSVVIPVYNKESTLARMLKSVFNQTYPLLVLKRINRMVQDGLTHMTRAYEDVVK